MNVSRWGLFCFLILFFAGANSESDSTAKPDLTLDSPRYVVFPGLDADSEEVAEWNIGFASPFNVFFGPKPYILGWVGEEPFGPVGEEEEEIQGEGDYEEEESEGELPGEVGEGEEELAPDYDYEKI